MKDEPLTLDSDVLSTIDLGDTITTIGYIDSSGLTNHGSDPYTLTTTHGGTGQLWTGSNKYTTANFQQPEVPTYIGAPGELFTDEAGYHWVMSKNGWKQIVQNDWTVQIEDPIEKGTKKKLKCF